MTELPRRAGALSGLNLSGLTFPGLALAALAATTAPVLAQTTADTGREGGFTLLGRIILGAGRARVAIDTPQAVTALEEEDLDREQAGVPGDFLRTVPGATGYGSGRMTGQFFNLRGVGTGSSSDENRIIVSIDGVPKYAEQYRMGSFFGEPELFRRVEVLRGPGSSILYGSGAIGGVVAFETREASDFLTGSENTALRLRAGFNSNGGGYLGSAILAHRFSERFEALGALTYRHDGDFRAGDGSVVQGSGMDAASGMLSATWRPVENSDQRLRFSFTRWHSDQDDANYAADINAPVFGLIDRTITDDTAQITWENPAPDNPWLDTRIQLSVSDTEVDQRNSTATIPSDLFADSVYGYRTVSINARNTITAQGGNWDNHLTFGAQASRQERTHRAGGGSRLAHPEGTSTRFGLYAQNEFIYNQSLTLIGGLRFDRTELNPTAGVPASAMQARTHQGTAGSLSAHYRLNDNWAVFGSVARTVRLPTLDEIFESGFQGGTVSLDLRPETAITREIGLSYSMTGLVSSGDSLDVKLTGFDNRFRDRIERIMVAGQPSFGNIARARIRGVELEASYDSATAFGRVALSAMEGTNTNTGARLDSVPAHELVVEYGRRFQQYGLEAGWRGTFADGATRANGDRFGGYGLHDLFVAWTPDQGVLAGATLQLSVNNVFDRQYYNILDGSLATAEPRRGRDLRITVGRTFTW
ncbi:TonB-dependent receptor domain-containing protein [Pararhodobacter sp.]|uniref:TonB-dependent receptor domain-containing protein n=1 Tax=Pararhodobacter sp. TaxID=2127056 RepID=UPI002FDD9602